MYFVPDDTQICGYYECAECGERFLDVRVVPYMVCPYCGEEVDMELGPDEEMPEIKEDAKLIKVIEGEEVEKMDGRAADSLRALRFYTDRDRARI